MRKSGQKMLSLVSDTGREVIDVKDLSGLPEELLKELSISDADVLERQILTVLEALGGSGDLDQVLIGLYRKFQVVQKRRFLQNKLWRMVRKGQVQKPGGARGIFRLETPKKHRKGRRK
ncbi:MAG TPA: hypothetical protein VMF58_18445 [Rhizomicrobium sp.]|nr:hypothetical protein [Rhizomicrobium sp.]